MIVAECLVVSEGDWRTWLVVLVSDAVLGYFYDCVPCNVLFLLMYCVAACLSCGIAFLLPFTVKQKTDGTFSLWNNYIAYYKTFGVEERTMRHLEQAYFIQQRRRPAFVFSQSGQLG